MSWYVIRTIRTMESRVEDGLRDIGVDHYAPKEKIWGRRQRDGKRLVLKRPVLPGYLFVSVDYPRESFGRVLDVVGVLDFLGLTRLEDGELGPLSIPAEEIGRFRLLEDQGAFDRAKAPKIAELEKGQRVRIVKGQFQGFAAAVASAKSGEKRVQILFSAFGRQSQMTIDRDHLQVTEETKAEQRHRLTRSGGDPLGCRSFGDMALDEKDAA